MAKTKEQVLTLGDTKVVLSEVNGLVQVAVETKDADVYYNGTLVAAAYPDENYKQIPPTMRAFIAGLDAELRDGGDGLDVDAVLEKERITFYFGSPRAAVRARFDDLVDLRILEYDLKELLPANKVAQVLLQLRGRMDIITSIIRSHGYDFKESHAYDGEFYAWWDVVMKPSQWNEEKFLACVRAITAAKQGIQEIMKEHKLPTA